MLNLAFRSVLVLGLLFGLLFAVLAGVMAYYEVSLWFAVAVTLLVAGLQYAIGPYIIQWIFKIHWMSPEQADPQMAQFLRQICAERRLRCPRFGLIEDGNPNAFTFGHYPGDARLVLTRGLLEVCDEEETQAVVAHEVGHIVHWDFVVMTIAATIPLLLYMIYRFGIGSRGRSDRNGGYAVAVAIGAFIAYIISEYLVLFLSRVREYYADEYSARATRNPRALATGLVKIAYGLARQPQETREKDKKKEQPAFSMAKAGGARALGIFDPGFGASMALAAAGSYGATGRQYDPEIIRRTMAWDLFNPWAWLVELRSSHPLPAKRIRHLERLGERVGQAPLFSLMQEARESYWDEFLGDLFVLLLPVLGLLVGLGAGLALGWTVERPLALGGLAGLGLALGMLVKAYRVYPLSGFPLRQVAQLVGNIKVSHIRCIPAKLEGQIIGRGIPGLYWSEDLVVQDSSGFMVMDYRQPLGILEFLFGLFRADRFSGQTVEALGWYRRFPRPYLELWKVRLPSGEVHTCHNRAFAVWGAWVLTVIALAVLFAGVAAAPLV